MNLQKITLIILWGAFINAVPAYAAEPVGIFLADVPGCSVTSGTKDLLCNKNLQIRPGDVIRYSKGAKKLPIQWLSEENIRLEKVDAAGERIVLTTATSKNDSVLDGMKGLSRPRSTDTRLGVSRDATISDFVVGERSAEKDCDTDKCHEQGKTQGEMRVPEKKCSGPGCE